MLVDAVHGHDARRVHDGRVEARLPALVEEHAVEHVTGRGLEAEADVRQSEDGPHVRDLALDAADPFDGLDAVLAALLDAGGERERVAVEEQVGGFDAVAVDGQVADAAGDLDLPVGGARLAVFVDAHAHDGGAVLARERHHAVEPLARLFALFEVGRVEDGLAADVLEARLEHLRLGGVEHQREARLGGDPAHDLGHVVGAAAADVVDADVEHVGAFLDLLLGELQGDVPVAGDHRVLELLGAVRVHALADGEERGVLVERDRAVDRRARRLVLHVPRRRRAGADAFDHRAQVRGSGAAATTDDVEPEVGDEALVRVGEHLGREVVVLTPVDDRRQPGVGQAREEGAAVLREIAEVLGHLRRPGRAVQARSRRGASPRGW